MDGDYSDACPNCPPFFIEVDPSRGLVVCSNCGLVLEETYIVSKVQFDQREYGGACVIGTYLGDNENPSLTRLIKSYRGCGDHGKTSRDITLKKARSNITTVANQLK